MFINLGELDSLDSTAMKQYISEVSGVDMESIVSAEIKSSFSFIEVKTEAAEVIQGTFKNVQYNNRSVRIESRGASEGRSSRGGYEGGGNRRSFGGGERKGGYGGGNRSERGGYRGNSGSGERKSGGYGERKSYGGGNSGERKSYGDRSDRGPSTERTERKSYSDREKSYSKNENSSSEKNYSKNESSGGGDRKSNFSRERRPRKQF